MFFSELGISMVSSLRLIVGLSLASAVAACASVGPAGVEHDRPDYSGSMASSWKEQMLLNIVKFRYFDPPVFLDVSSVVSTRELQTQADATARLFPHPYTTSQGYGNFAVSGRYTDRPTVSYTPLTGDRFINSLLRPIPPQTVFTMIDAGHDADFLLSLTVRSINGIYNYSLAPAQARPENPKFRELTSAIRRIQQAGAIGTRSGKTGKLSKTWIFFRHKAVGAVENDIRRVKTLLGLAPQRDEFVLTGGPNHKPDEIAVRTRSLQQILAELAAGVQVPAADVADNRATRVPVVAADAMPLIHIHSSAAPPVDAYTAAFYRNRWFWIDDRDLRSKQVFMFLLMMSALSETRAVPQMPIVTIPTN
jgi:hypothetical protein